jgi:hypothetical protein
MLPEASEAFYLVAPSISARLNRALQLRGRDVYREKRLKYSIRCLTSGRICLESGKNVLISDMP